MLADRCLPITSLYPVEISGWDRNQVFFVEKAELEWSETSGKHVVLSRTLSEKAIIFVRLLQPNASDRSYPVAHEAVSLGTTPVGRHQFRLCAVHPRPRD